MFTCCKSSIKLRGGAFLILGNPEEGGLNREGGLLERGAHSQNKVTWMNFVAFQFFYPEMPLRLQDYLIKSRNNFHRNFTKGSMKTYHAMPKHNA